MKTIPVSAIVPTRNRPAALRRTLESLADQGVFPSQLIVVNASENNETHEALNRFHTVINGEASIQWMRAEIRGAAAQRNQAMAAARHPAIWFFDDDIIFQPECVTCLWDALNSDGRLGGVNAMIVNQRYQPPGRASRILFRLLHGRHEATYAGMVIGPAVNLLPEDSETLPEVVPVQWLNTTCAMYRREALPSPLFESVFTGYSLMEDLALSLMVGEQWKLANARTARIYHDSQPSSEKDDVRGMAAMELANRHYVMTRVLGRRATGDYARLLLWEAFQVGTTAIASGNLQMFLAQCSGKMEGVRRARRTPTENHRDC